MNQDKLILFLLKIILLADVVAILGFIVQYTRLAPWWRDQIGRTIVIKDLLLLLGLLPTVLSLFFQFSRFGSHVAAWIDVALFGAMSPVMVWRIVIWQRIHGFTKDES